jgi:hypothetical protein
MNDGNRKPTHPLKMMAADYDARVRQDYPASLHPSSQRPSREANHFSHHRGKGKGRHKNDSSMGSIEDYLSPDIIEDPWIDLYARLSVESRTAVTRHLTPSEVSRMERNIVDTQTVKRVQTIDSTNSF